MIAFIGSVFSPYYAWARRRCRAVAPENHVAINVAIYGAGGYRWAMTERGHSALRRDAVSLTIGPSRLTWTADGALVIDIDEVAVPMPRRLQGRVTIRPRLVGTADFTLDAAGRHHWQPIAPRAAVEVQMSSPRQRWSGSAYVDHNRGSEPLAEAFRSWNWSRTIEDTRTRIFYDVARRDGTLGRHHLDYTDAGTPQRLTKPVTLTPMPRSLWRMERAAASDHNTRPRVLETWEDGPFYARSLIEQDLQGQAVRAVHEAVSLDRFSRSIVQAMLPFRMPRRR